MNCVIIYHVVSCLFVYLFQNGSILLGMFAKFRKVNVSFVMSAYLLVRMELLSCHWTGFHEI